MNILGYNYEIDYSQREDQLGSLGRCSGKLLRIEIANDMPPQQTQSTMLHEIIEAINYHLQLHLEHGVIAALETSMYQVLVQNGIDLTPLVTKQDQIE
jgi:hypothetical protein